MPKILVVDDEEDQEELIMQRFAHKDYLHEYEFIFARNGLKALQLIKAHADIDVALLDINMPEMDGLTLLEKIKEINPMMRSVMLSAYGDMSNIRTAMNRGAFDFLNKPIDVTDLGITIKKTIEEVKRLKETARTVHENLILKQKASELEMQVLRAQMNPHFIFNCLSSINRFILKNESETASDYLTKFSRLIRMVLNNSNKNLIILEDELEMLRLYLDLEKLRFKNSFDYSITFHNNFDAASIFIPPLLLQPFAENAIWHGLIHKEGQGVLEIAFELDNNMLICYITDNGIGRKKAEALKSKSAEKQKSMGMQITADRLALLNKDVEQTTFSVEDLVDAEGRAAGTKVTLKIRYKETIEEFA
jgi:CheY-like chemotaxis protein